LCASAEARKIYRWAERAHKHLPDTVENRRRRVDTSVKVCVVSWLSDPPEELLERAQEAERLVQDLVDGYGAAEDRLRLAQIHYWLGRIHYMHAAYREATDYFEQVLPVARELDDQELLALPSLAVGQATAMRGQYPEAEKLIREALPLLEKTGSWREWVNASAIHGFLVVAMGDPSAGISEAERAVDKAQELKSLTESAASRSPLAGAYLFADELPSALECADRLAEIAEQSNDRVLLSYAYGWRGWAESRMKDHDSASESMARSQQIAKELGGRLHLHGDWFLAARAEVALGAGRLEEVIGLAEGTTEIPLIPLGLIQRSWGQALDALETPRPDEAETHLMQSVATLEDGSHQLEAARSRVALAKHYYDRNNITAAQTELEKALEQWEASGLTREAKRTRDFLVGLQS
ncbi:MAG: tetratricopeptide repeat protein, partial [bacterium]|nr:tetratricopeptide repeat protein [bacterium]